MIGLYKSHKLNERRKTLMELENSLSLLETEIESSIVTLPQAFSRIKAKSVKEAFLSAAKKMQQGKRADSAFISSIPMLPGLAGEDENVLISFARGLLSIDKEGQIRNIKLTQKRISALRAEAEEEYKRMGKLYKQGGVLAGIMVAIILY